MHCQLPWQWASNAQGSNSESGNAVCTDQNGNVIVAGYFYSNQMVIGTYTLTNYGNYDFFVVKYDQFGNVIWAKSGGGSNDDVALGVACDLSGNVFITGYYYSAILNSGASATSNNGIGDIFIIKYDSFGNQLFLKSVGGINDESSTSISTDNSGNVYVCGYFKSSLITLDSYTLNNSGNSDAFVCKLNNSGTTLWAKNFLGGGNDAATSVGCDQQGSLYVTGYYYSSVFSIGTSTLTSSGSSDIFTLKLDTSGNCLWAASAGGNLNDSGHSVTSDLNGNVYVTGMFLSPTFSAGSGTLSNGGNNDMALIKYNSTGAVMWAKSASGIFDETGASVATDGLNSVYVAGHIHSPNASFSQLNIFNSGVGDGYVAHYDSSGNVIAVQGLGGVNDDGINGIHGDAVGNMYVTGFFNSPQIFFGSDTLFNTGAEDFLTAKFLMTPNSEEKVFQENENIIIYPMPSNGEITIYSPGSEIMRVKIYSSSGSLIKQYDSEGIKSLKVFIKNSGVYIAHISTRYSTIIRRIVII